MVTSNSSMTPPSHNHSDGGIPQDGYDLPLYGVEDGRFVIVHASALVCISLSLCCVMVVLSLCRNELKRKKFSSVAQQRNNSKPRSFYSWTKGERFIIYLCVCDGLFNVFHFIDHTYILATRGHVEPPGLCQFYAFVIVMFISAQVLMVNLIAVNAFLLIYFQKNIDLGKYDYKLLTWTFGVPFLTCVVCLSLGVFGPNGIM